MSFPINLDCSQSLKKNNTFKLIKILLISFNFIVIYTFYLLFITFRKTIKIVQLF